MASFKSFGSLCIVPAEIVTFLIHIIVSQPIHEGYTLLFLAYCDINQIHVAGISSAEPLLGADLDKHNNKNI